MTDPTPKERAQSVVRRLCGDDANLDPNDENGPMLQVVEAEIRAALEAERRLWMEAAGWTDSVFSDASMVPAAILAVLAQKKAGVALERAVTAIESLMSHDGPYYDDTPENHALADARDAVLALNPESQG